MEDNHSYDSVNPYNPLDKKNLGESVVAALLANSVVPLAGLSVFNGAGIYAIYYTGSFPPYAAIRSENESNRFGRPIYVGKAVPSGARKGGVALGKIQTPVLFNRLNDHAKSVREAENLNLKDFWCRFLNVDDIWIPLAESLLIQAYTPLWNVVVEGFGNHDPGGGRTGQQKSAWDTLHPGRLWAKPLKNAKFSYDELLVRINNHISSSEDKKE